MNLSNNINVMIDLETLSTEPTAAILSIGAVSFFCDDPKEFYDKVDTKENLAGFDTSASTLAWWDKQNSTVRAEAFSGTKPLNVVLDGLTEFLDSLQRPVTVWGKGANFDISILEHAYKVYSKKIPWKFTNIRCYRTLEAIAQIQLPKMDFFAKHNALADARHQARCAEMIMKSL